MKEPTHFVEQFINTENGVISDSGLQPIIFLETALNNTRTSRKLKTVAVWKKTPKELLSPETQSTGREY